MQFAAGVDAAEAVSHDVRTCTGARSASIVSSSAAFDTQVEKRCVSSAQIQASIPVFDSKKKIVSMFERRTPDRSEPARKSLT